MFDHPPRRLLLTSVLAGGLALAACGTGAASGGGSSGGDMQGTTIAVRSTDQGEVLTDARGRTLYESDQENGTPTCTSSDCTAIWTALTVSGGGEPTASSGVTGSVTTTQRPDGSRQVVLDGKPLYTFSFDHAPGDTSGDGVQDEFGGTRFTWHAATPAGSTRGTPSAPPSTGYSY